MFSLITINISAGMTDLSWLSHPGTGLFFFSFFLFFSFLLSLGLSRLYGVLLYSRLVMRLLFHAVGIAMILFLSAKVQPASTQGTDSRWEKKERMKQCQKIEHHSVVSCVLMCMTLVSFQVLPGEGCATLSAGL